MATLGFFNSIAVSNSPSTHLLVYVSVLASRRKLFTPLSSSTLKDMNTRFVGISILLKLAVGGLYQRRHHLSRPTLQ